MTSSLCPAQREDRTSYMTHLWSVCLEKHHDLLGFSSNTRWSHSLLLQSYTSEARASSSFSLGGLSTPSKGQCPADYSTTIAKTTQSTLLWTTQSCSLRASQIPLTPFCYLSCQKELSLFYYHLHSTIHLLSVIHVLSKGHLLVNLTMKRGRFVQPLPFWIQGLRCLQLMMLENTATPKTPMGIKEPIRDLRQCCLDLHVFKSVVLTAHSPEYNQSQGGRSLTGNKEVLAVHS